jgi:hypothetical protein
MARPATPRRPADRRTGRLDRSAQRHIPRDSEPTSAPGSEPAADGAPVPTAPVHPAEEAANALVTPNSFWALLPAADRERLGLRLSRLVLKAVRPPTFHSEEDA